MSDRPIPTPEHERNFLFNQSKEVIRRAERPDECDRDLLIRFESPTHGNNKVTFSGKPREVIEQIATHDRTVARRMAETAHR